MNLEQQKYIKENIHLIKDSEWEKFFDYRIPSGIGEPLYISGIDFMTHLKEVPFHAFYKTNLNSITIPDTVTSIRDFAFGWSSSLKSIKIPSSVTSIGAYAFANCSSLTSITIPDSVTIIGDYAFYHCSSLKNITIPDGVTIINESTFLSCDELETVVIHKGLTFIGGDAFKECFKLEEIKFNGTKDDFKAIKRARSWIDHTIKIKCTNGNLVYTRK